MKKAFTLFELLIAMILISLLYYFAINSFQNKSFKINDSISLKNLKINLLKNYDFEDNIKIQCIEDDLSCFIFLDGILQKEKLTTIFKNIPTIYKYSDKLETIEFQPLELEELESYNIIFKYSCKKNHQCDEYIVETNKAVFIFDDLYNSAKELNSTNEINEYFDKLKREVKDAF